MALVRYVVNNILSTPGRNLQSLSKDDLIQEGSLGLARAIDKYDPANPRKAAFSTYAVYWIRASVLRSIAERDELIRVPEHVTSAIKKLRHAASILGIETDSNMNIKNQSSSRAWREATIAKTLAEQAGISPDMLKEAAKVDMRRKVSGGAYLSLEDWMQKHAASGNVNDLANYQTPRGLQDMYKEDYSQYLRAIFSPFLSKKEMEALSLRYGLKSQPYSTNEKQLTNVIINEATPKIDEPTFRDYEAEAEKDIFGPNGILYSSATANDLKGDVPRRNMAPTILVGTERAPYSNITTLKSKHGGRWGEAMSFKEVGKQMCVSAEYGRRLCGN
eukprot:CAMPEP_0184868736 /NCGR_PEP_ID=MMETSP0580-20130426/31574_1 /TAXON_ID=1118495 /ORGANISM="Dactyliosolen fragilissimus" /LENGTH=331 /DNA_ID=CAMNT_0027369823 /DNA_START=733 /DNA_END=1725 /DNA_ORIENTATION=-